ncbi:MAG: ABC transporter permease [Candidatus Rokubacteria bacterium]|nr:ABC transporter permease [Candidatus Rokubacteria bacterium]
MVTYILRRILLMVPTLLGAVTLIFLVMRLLPGDAALYILGSDEASQLNKEALAQVRQELGLDHSLPVQYVQWLWGVVRLDFGTSYWTKQPVIEELAQRYPMTANLAVLSLLLSTVIAVPIGVLSAVKQDTFADYAARIFVITGLSLPNFWLAILIILGLVHYFRWLPPLDYAPFWVDPWLNVKQLVFPAAATGYRLSAISARMTRSSVLEVLRDDYVRTARAKGLHERAVVLKHALRNALLPVITITSVELLILFGGLVVVETVFTIPGIGRFLVDAIIHRDYPSIQALVFVFSVFVVVVNLLVDIIYALLDPRIRYA